MHNKQTSLIKKAIIAAGIFAIGGITAASAATVTQFRTKGDYLCADGAV